MRLEPFLSEGEVCRLPRPPLPGITPVGFVIGPAFFTQGLTAEQLFWQQALYQLAFEQAQQVAQPSLPERNLLAVWN